MPDQTVIACGIQAGTNVVVPIAVDAAGHPIIQLDTLSNAAGIIVTGSAAGIVTMPRQSGCSVWRNGNQAIPLNIWTRVQLNAEHWDIQNEFDPLVNFQFTATEAGIYACKASVFFDVVGDQNSLAIDFRQNGVSQKSIFLTASSGRFQSVAGGCDLQLAIGDTIALYAINATAADILLGVVFRYTWMMIAKIA